MRDGRVRSRIMVDQHEFACEHVTLAMLHRCCLISFFSGARHRQRKV